MDEETAPRAAASGRAVSASPTAQAATAAILGAGVLLALLWPEEAKKAFQPAAGFATLTGFYVAAQAIERVMELLPGGDGSKQAKANRAVVFAAIGFVLAVLVSETLHLYLVSSLGSGKVDLDLDVIITALAIGGGTKPLHDGIKRIEKAKETPTTTT